MPHPVHMSGAIRRSTTFLARSGGHDAGPEAVSGIGCDGQHLLLLAVERIGVEAELFVPERFVELVEQCAGFRTQRLRAIRLAERIEHLGHAHPGIVDIALQLTEGLWPFDQRAVGIDNAITRILPAHVLVTNRGAGLVLLESVAVAVAIIVDPGEAPFCRLEMPLQERPVAGRAPDGVQRNQVERRRICGTVIRRVRDQLEMRKLAVAHLVHYLAGLGVAVVVRFLRLQGAEDLQCSARKLRID